METCLPVFQRPCPRTCSFFLLCLVHLWWHRGWSPPSSSPKGGKYLTRFYLSPSILIFADWSLKTHLHFCLNFQTSYLPLNCSSLGLVPSLPKTALSEVCNDCHKEKDTAMFITFLDLSGVLRAPLGLEMPSVPLALRIPVLSRICSCFSAHLFANLLFPSNILEISHGLIIGLGSSNLCVPTIPTLLLSLSPAAFPLPCLSVTASPEVPCFVHCSAPPILLLLTVHPLQGSEMPFGNTTPPAQSPLLHTFCDSPKF